ncbi:hypothetical protein IWQ61_009851 [Dispira simplex]|nr:hypothetical protein IWQ61_009851 [Dispira simplex]
MKLACFTTLSVVITCLSGSVWAEEEIYNPKVTQDFCDALYKEYGPDEYYGPMYVEEIKKLRELTKPGVSIEELNEDSVIVQEIEESRNLAMPGVSTEEPNKLLPKKIIGAAKMFLFDKQYLSKAFDVSQEIAIDSYRFYAWIAYNGLVTFWPLTENEHFKEYYNRYKGKRFKMFQLSNTNPVENKAADFIEECIKMRVENENREQR